MENVEIKDMRIGNRVEFDGGKHSSKVLDVDYTNKTFKGDYLNYKMEHNRDKWISFNRVMLCQKSTIPPHVAESIMNDIQQRHFIHI